MARAPRTTSEANAANADAIAAIIQVAFIRFRDGDFQGALGPVLVASAEHPNNADLWAALGDLMVHGGEVGMGGNAFQEALKRDPANMRAALGRATFCAMGGRHDEARERFELLLARADAQHYPEGHPFYMPPEALRRVVSLNLAQLECQTGHFERAEALVTPWLADPASWHQAGAILEDAVAGQGLDPVARAFQDLIGGRFTPFQVQHILAMMLDDHEPELEAIAEVVEALFACFPYDLGEALPVLDGLLRRFEALKLRAKRN